MKGLITLAMKGRMQAVVATVLSALLALIVTPVAVASAALVVLATLRNGAREGLLLVASATLAIAGAGGLLFGMPLAIALLGLVLWLPAWGLGVAFGRSGSLGRTLEIAAIGGALLVAAQYLVLGDPAEYWHAMLKEYMAATLDPTVVPEAERQQLLKAIAAWMPGGVGASWTLSLSLSVLLGRWAQSVLERPGAFGAEFREFRCSRPWLILLPLLLVPTFLLQGNQPGAMAQLYLVAMTLFLLQGISTVHGLVNLSGGQKGWLFGLYFVLLVGAPHSVTAIAAAGYADGWLDFRARVRARRGGS